MKKGVNSSGTVHSGEIFREKGNAPINGLMGGGAGNPRE